MTFFLFTMMSIFVVFAVVRGILEIISRKRYRLAWSNTKAMSTAGKHLIREYQSLPVENRPRANISMIVEALDTKYNTSEVDIHFRRHGYDSSYFSWNCRCFLRDRCPYREYPELHTSMKNIKDALNKQQHQLALAGVSGGLDEARELMSRLREEKELIESVTEQLT